jgi:hypothetical protein
MMTEGGPADRAERDSPAGDPLSRQVAAVIRARQDIITADAAAIFPLFLLALADAVEEAVGRARAGGRSLVHHVTVP